MFASTVLFTECQIQLFHWTFPSHGSTAMLCWLWKKTDFMFIAVFWGCCPKYSPRCLLRNSKRKQPKKFLFREKNQLKSRKCCWWFIQRLQNRSMKATMHSYSTLLKNTWCLRNVKTIWLVVWAPPIITILHVRVVIEGRGVSMRIREIA